MAIYRGAGGAGDATGDSASEALLVRELAAEVQLDADAAEAAKLAALAAQAAAETAETNAETAETNAETAATNAAASASSASSSASTATTQAGIATTQATNASNSATAAASSASSASTSATNAASSASAAATSATNANNSANAASTSATNAANSATAAASSASTATTQATNASNSATAAATSATNAASSATSASNSASTATTQAGIATTQATNAANSATAAATSATNASNSASAAATSATNASNSASAASTSATNASNSATAAATSATNAANSATAASGFADDASDSADAAAASAASINLSSIAITGGSINGTTIGASTASTGAFTTLSATGVATVSAGSVSAPAITTTGDTNTGIFFPAADTIAFTEGGSEAMRITSAGNVGIGTSSPSAVTGYTVLTLNNASNGGIIDFQNNTSLVGRIYNNSTNFHIYNQTANPLLFGTGGSEKMRLDSSGNLGIGVTPSAWDGAGIKAFDIGAVGTVFGSNATTQVLRNTYFNGSNYIYKTTTSANRYAQTTTGHEWHTAPSGTAGNAITFTQAMTLDASGNLTIGSTTSLGKLGVWSSTNGDTIAAFRCSGTGTQRSLLVSVDNSTGVVKLDASGAAAGSMAFAYGGTEAMRITTAGNVGIGTSNPTRKLDVNDSSSANSIPLALSNLTGGTNIASTGINFNAHSNVNFARIVGGQQTDGSFADGNLIFLTRNAETVAERMRIDSSGNVGIGTSSPQAKLDLGIGVGRKLNIYNDGSNAISGFGTDIGGASYELSCYAGGNGANLGVFTWLAYNRTANTYAERMRIDNSGNLLVGTTSPFGGATNQINIGSASASILTLVNTTTANSSSGLRIIKAGATNNTSQIYINFAYNGGNNGNGAIAGNGDSQATFISQSDVRLKENIQELPPQLDKIMALRPVEFDYIATGGHQIGFIAQEVQQVYPDLVSEDDEGFLNLAGLDKNASRLIKAIQEQQAIIQSQADTITAMEARLTALENK
jgi:hypothetical protein